MDANNNNGSTETAGLSKEQLSKVDGGTTGASSEFRCRKCGCRIPASEYNKNDGYCLKCIQ
jgi:hypothetical protein